MKSTLVIAAFAALLGGAPAIAQTSSDIAVAPPRGSTGPTVQDTRQLDQNTALPPSTSAAPGGGNSIGYGNWRTSDGFNIDPNNPSGAPGSSSIGTNPTR
jgi:hypothetical protein